MVGIGQVIHSCPVCYRSIEHLAFIQLAYVTGQTIFIGRQQQTPFIKCGVCMRCRFGKTSWLRKQRCLRQAIDGVSFIGSITKSYQGCFSPFFGRNGVDKRSQHPFRFRHVRHRQAQNRRRFLQRIFTLEKSGNQFLSGILH